MSSRSIRLLVVDDEAAQVTALVRTLEREGYDSSGVHSAQEALAALQASRFDILITDLKMPDMDDVALLRAAQAIDSNLVSIVMTGHGTIDTAVEALKSGALESANRDLHEANRHLAALAATVSRRLHEPLLELVGLSNAFFWEEAGSLTARQRQRVETIAQRARELAHQAQELLRVLGTR